MGVRPVVLHACYIGPNVPRAKVKSIEIAEVPDLKPESYLPDDFEDFQCTFGLSIGPSDADGADLFYIMVCTPKSLARTCERDGFVWGRHLLILPHYDLRAITRTITKFVEGCSGESWRDMALRVSRLASWEFEDYAENS